MIPLVCEKNYRNHKAGRRDEENTLRRGTENASIKSSSSVDFDPISHLTMTVLTWPKL